MATSSNNYLYSFLFFILLSYFTSQLQFPLLSLPSASPPAAPFPQISPLRKEQAFQRTSTKHGITSCRKIDHIISNTQWQRLYIVIGNERKGSIMRNYWTKSDWKPAGQTSHLLSCLPIPPLSCWLPIRSPSKISLICHFQHLRVSISSFT